MAGPLAILGGAAAVLLTKRGVDEIMKGLDDEEDEEEE